MPRLGYFLLAAIGSLVLATPAAASDGTWERAWGKGVNGGAAFGVCTLASSCASGQVGGLGGEMHTPLGVATDANGNVYVADYLHNKIVKFDASGTWERTWGKDVNATNPGNLCTAASGDACQAGSSGGHGGELTTPSGV